MIILNNKQEATVSVSIFLGSYALLLGLAHSAGANIGIDQSVIPLLIPPLGALWLTYSKHSKRQPKGREWISLRFSALTAVVAACCLLIPFNIMRLLQ